MERTPSEFEEKIVKISLPAMRSALVPVFGKATAPGLERTAGAMDGGSRQRREQY